MTQREYRERAARIDALADYVNDPQVRAQMRALAREYRELANGDGLEAEARQGAVN